jgi:copper transport protein
VLLILTPASALAHASYVRSDPPDLCGPLAVPQLPPNDPRCQTGIVMPSAPSAISITFSEPISLLGPGVRVLAPSGRRVDKPPAQAHGAQASVAINISEPGTYVVIWQVESADTHPARGQFAFSVGQPSKPAVSAEGLSVGAVTPAGLALQTLARWLRFGGYALAFGVLGFLLLAARPIAPAARRVVNCGILVLLLAEPLALLGQTASLGLDQMLESDVIGDALASSFGRLMGFRIAAALLLWVLSPSLQPSRRIPDSAPSPEPAAPHPRAAAAAFAALAVALAVIDAFGQHAASFRPEWLGVAVHALHLMSMGLWLGGLAGALVARHAQFHLRHSTIALIAATTLAVSATTGLAMAAVHLQSPSPVLTGTYGQVLGIKQLFVLAAIAAGWLALRGRRKKWALSEAGALLCIIVAAGLLVSLPPPH